jgi:hypothetical protein
MCNSAGLGGLGRKLGMSCVQGVVIGGGVLGFSHEGKSGRWDAMIYLSKPASKRNAKDREEKRGQQKDRKHQGPYYPNNETGSIVRSPRTRLPRYRGT